MPSDDKSHYTPAPPIPTYDEAVHSSTSNNDWQPPPRSPADFRPDAETEAQSLLTSSAGQRPRVPAGYRPPHVETDDEESNWSLESDDDDDAPEDAQMRREMQELEVEDPLNGSSASSNSSLWRKRINFSLPQWKWRWRLPRLTVRLPRQTDGITESRSESGTEETSSNVRRWRLPKIGMDSAAVLILIGRLLALFLVMGFLYLIFMSDLFANFSRRVGGKMFDPESVRAHVQVAISTGRMRDTLEHFTRYAHIAGTEGDYALAMDVHNAFVKSGLEDVRSEEYYVYLNYPKPDGRAVQIMDEDGKKAKWSAKLEEDDTHGATAGRQTLAFHGHSKSGDVRGPLIYANYGSREDFQKLKDKGIETKGAIALVRYYGTQGDRALKIKAAELAGFAGCIIYSDPADDGFVKGETAPEGRFMPKDGVQRGGVSLMSWVVGDVLTPGWASTKGQPRMTPTQTKGLVQIPSLPLAWRDAQVLLQHIQGFGEPCADDWRGGVPDVEWWSGNASSPIVRLKNEQDENEQQPIWNIYGKIIGIEQNDKSIIIGSHRDAWGFGATDPGSGQTVFLEVARVFGDLLARGWRPLRTIEFMSWDAEEYNLIGSTEYVENNLDALRADAFAYVNLDTAVTGADFAAAGSPMFKAVLPKVLERVYDTKRNASLRMLWEERRAHLEGLGAGSDYVAFQDIAGTSSLDLRFEGDRFPYHSSYDNFDWMTRVGDPDLMYHGLLGQVLSLLILELADKPVLPFDVGAYARAMGRYLSDLWKWCEVKGVKLDFTPIKKAIDEVENAVMQAQLWAIKWEEDVTSANGWEPAALGRLRTAYNSRMADFETALLDLEYGGGIPNRTQFVHTIFGPQLWSGYDEAYFPAIRDAVESGDLELAQNITDKTGKIISEAAKVLIREKSD
ncbi:glutamate carboxypeptidase [Apiospora kogelbergensis]|uniref:Glutamate carboxypeptidase n=1 Tax=Apiospora kogelbergensis TaxID=1337665 RepID=A0AAW0QJX1_9PEZI